MTGTDLRAGGRTVRIERADKVLFPADGGTGALTKADLAAHYRRVARRILPRLRGRPLMLERYPDGIDGPRLVQKDTPGTSRSGSAAANCPRRAAPSPTPSATTWPPCSTSPAKPASPRTAGSPGPTGPTTPTCW
ncbi:hypothetical protein KSE_05330 [Kitasatospora setae KM-6054]|uniref:DNA ligase D polymerase domain-containing protein n=1 Tax=Kitasatospora setae (strain ATCC 33774 / DSM 43861 / JCM 3304 / KCC A-0304 / NBRC 14216 / KM-6054) TaxID=452652 RepID=E4N598_KITSK|nr:hypothetical protein KSE_05330 [Kitasatospora setae KM-6054]